MSKANMDIRKEIEKAGLKYWEVAVALGCADTTFTRRLRHELLQAEKDKIIAIIDRLTAGKQPA